MAPRKPSTTLRAGGAAGLFLAVLACCVLYMRRHSVYRFFVLRALGRIAWGRITVDDALGRTELGPHADATGLHVRVRVHDHRAFYAAAALRGDVGLGEAFVAGAWDCDSMPALMTVLCGNVERVAGRLRTHPASAASLLRDSAAAQHHYDVGNEFYATFLTDRLMAYTCGFFTCPDDSLDRAQHNKVDRVIAKLDVRRGWTSGAGGGAWPPTSRSAPGRA